MAHDEVEDGLERHVFDGGLVEAASLTFLVTFSGVTALCAMRIRKGRVLATFGAGGAAGAAVVAAWRLAREEPVALAVLAVLVLVAVVGRPVLLRRQPR